MLSLLSLSLSDKIDAKEWFTSQELNQAVELRNQAILDTSGYNIVESLTTEVGPRLAGSAGDKLAVKWATAKLNELGFDKVWKEEVTYPTWVRESETARILSPFPQKVHITALGNSVGTEATGIKGEVIQFSSLEMLKDADEAEIKGKIVFISKRMSASKDGKDYGPTVAARVNGANVASNKGAVALMIRSVGTDNNRTPHTGVLHYEEGIRKIPAVALSNPDSDLLIRQLRRNKTLEMEINLNVHEGPEVTSYNVIGEITGSELPDEIVILGAHLDSWDLGTGAIDDGAGVAIVSAAAHLIGKLEKAPKRTIRVVLFANEETGLWGGKAYKKAHIKQLGKHLVGAESDFGAGRIYQLDAKVDVESWPAIEKMAAVLSPLGIVLGGNEGSSGPDLSPFAKAGLPALSLRQDGTDYFNWHHTSNDTLDKISPDDLAQNVAAYVVVAYLSAQMQGDFGSPLTK